MENKRTILLVEDEQPLLQVAKMKLEEMGYKVFPCATVDNALDLLRRDINIDAVWLDHYLPGKNGLELVLFMKQSASKYKDTPIFLVSNSASADRIYQYLQLGVRGYFIKSENKLEDIIENIRQAINSKE